MIYADRKNVIRFPAVHSVKPDFREKSHGPLWPHTRRLPPALAGGHNQKVGQKTHLHRASPPPCILKRLSKTKFDRLRTALFSLPSYYLGRPTEYFSRYRAIPGQVACVPRTIASRLCSSPTLNTGRTLGRKHESKCYSYFEVAHRKLFFKKNISTQRLVGQHTR